MSKTSWRYEKKIIFFGLSQEKILNNVVLSPALFRTGYPSRQINNLYLDTQNLDCFYNHTCGVGRRFKARLRWYGSFDSEFEKAHLEIKFREAEAGSKYVYQNTTPILKMDRLHISDAIKKMQMPESFKEQLLVMQPVLYNKYHRAYYHSLTGNIRITVDQNIAYRSVESHTWIPENEGLRILELKFDVPDAAAGKRILQHFPEAMERSSKYVRGILRAKNI